MPVTEHPAGAFFILFANRFPLPFVIRQDTVRESMVVENIKFISGPQVGKSLRKMREQAKLSQEQVAKKAKMPSSMLCRLEMGKGNPTVGTVSRIVKAIEGLS